MKLAIVVPCYNEQEVLDESAKRLDEVVQKLIGAGKVSADSYVLLVNDGSKDTTWQKICENNNKYSTVRGLKLAGNVGHQNALLAGLMTAKEDADIMISIDADLQDDVNVIPEMVDKYLAGCDIVYGVRNNRDTDSFFKRTSALAFYKLMHMMGVKSVYNHADYRLMSKRAVEQLAKYEERNVFLRGIVPLIGYKTDCVYYKRAERFAGESKYPLKKMLSFAWDGITSFSIKPITMISGLGFICTILSLIAAIYFAIGSITGNTVPGWASLIVSIFFIGGMQLLAIGIVGQYIGKIYVEVKRRPRYNIEEELMNEETKDEER